MLAELAAAVRDGIVDPIHLVDESLRRIAASHDDLNAVVALRADEARADAARSTRTGALAGLPMLVKDLGACRGMRTTHGSSMFADAPVDEIDDIAVARLRAAGAIVIGRTNTPAFGSSSTTTNDLFGTTRNPWNPARCPGGSSGGSATALAAGLVPLATGSDGGGSVRIPASCCGLVGYKPTMGRIGRDVVPAWMSFAAAGVMGRTVADVVLEASVICGPATGDLLAAPNAAYDPTPAQPARVLACRSFRGYLDPGFEAEFDELVATLSAAGHDVVVVESPFDLSTVRAWLTISTTDLTQSLLWCRDRWDELEPGLHAGLVASLDVPAMDYIAAQRQRYADTARLDELLGSDAVLLVPTINVQSWPAEGPFPRGVAGVTDDPFVGLNTPELNFTTHPAVSVPLGLDTAGVPFGVQIVAPRYGDHLALGFAAEIERVRPWPLVAPAYDPFPGVALLSTKESTC